MKRFFIISSLALFLFACKNSKQASEALVEDITIEVAADSLTLEAPVSPTDTLVYYRRTPCFGRCPSFELIVYQNRTASYEGQNFVNRIGKYTGEVSEENIKVLMELAEDMGYFQLDDVYDNRFVTDLPATITEIDGKRVMNRYEGPDLSRLYNQLDTLIENTPWNLQSQN